MTSLSPFEKQVAVITGGADGLGFALACRLAQSGATVCLLDISEEKLKSAEVRIGKSCRSFKADVSDPASIAVAIMAVITEFHRIDILVNGAGITGKTNLRSDEVDILDFDRVIALNVRGTFLVCQAVLPVMVAQGYGRILNMASIAGKDGNAGMVAYSTSKAAVIGMTKAMGKEYAETGVLINALAPAVIRTAMHDTMPAEQIKYMTDKIPMKRCGTVEEFAATAQFIVSPENSFSTGFCFDLSGGRATY